MGCTLRPVCRCTSNWLLISILMCVYWKHKPHESRLHRQPRFSSMWKCTLHNVNNCWNLPSLVDPSGPKLSTPVCLPDPPFWGSGNETRSTKPFLHGKTRVPRMHRLGTYLGNEGKHGHPQSEVFCTMCIPGIDFLDSAWEWSLLATLIKKSLLSHVIWTLEFEKQG